MPKAIFSIVKISYIGVILGLFLYSYTQVDLNLTLSQWSIWQNIQKSFQYIGWFQRPLSTALYVGILVLLFLFYGLFLYAVKKKLFSLKAFWILIGSVTFVLAFSYNAFSYDLFNYMFDARIVTFHAQNPYEHKALDYPYDPWINFMRWTHRVYPYGPVWLGLTIPLSFIGFQAFLPTLFLFKALSSASFLLSVWCIGKIASLINKDRLFAMALFALNPLVLIEGIVSSHNDIVMMAFGLLSIYFFLENHLTRSIVFLALSIGVKFATALLLPIYLYGWYTKRTNKSLFLLLCLIFMISAVVIATIRTNFQPWYLLNVFPLLSLFADKKAILFSYVVFSVFALSQYIPFLYTGNWNPPIPTILFWLTIIPTAVSLFALLMYRKTTA